MNTATFLACVCWPLALVAGLAARRGQGLARALAPWAALPAVFLGASAGLEAFRVEWLMLGGNLGVDAIAVVMLPMTAGLWLAAGLFARHYLHRGPRQDRFFAWFLIAMSGNLLLLVALDAIVFYLGFALMSFASYGLVVHEGDARARHAGRYYITLVLLGEVCVISALMMLASRAPTDFASLQASYLVDDAGRNDLIIGLLLVGFGIKAGVFGLHFWLPLAHPVAPAPASAVLSGAMIKAGLVAWMRLLPLGEMALPGWGAMLAWLGLITAYYGALVGLPQREAKTVLAYSSVSQMGLMTLMIGLGMIFPEHWPTLCAALLLYMAHHCLVKGGLFLGAGLVQHALGRMMAGVVAVALSLGALAMAGGPLTAGLVAKLALKHSAVLLADPWGPWLPLWLSMSSALTGLLMLRFLAIVWPWPSSHGGPESYGLIVPWLTLSAAALVVPWWLAAPELRAQAMGLWPLWSATWPVAMAGVLAIVAIRLRSRGRLPAMPRVPPGDLGIALEAGLCALSRAFSRLLNAGVPALLLGLRLMARGAIRNAPGWSLRLAGSEARIATWSVTGMLVLVLAAAFALLLA
jgi:hydrogenase-4 component B